MIQFYKNVMDCEEPTDSVEYHEYRNSYDSVFLKIIYHIKVYNCKEKFQFTKIPGLNNEFFREFTLIYEELIESECPIFDNIICDIPTDIAAPLFIKLHDDYYSGEGIEEREIDHDNFCVSEWYQEYSDIFTLCSSKLYEYFELLKLIPPEEHQLYQKDEVNSLLDLCMQGNTTIYMHNECFYLVCFIDVTGENVSPIWDLDMIPIYKRIGEIVEQQLVKLKAQLNETIVA